VADTHTTESVRPLARSPRPSARGLFFGKARPLPPPGSVEELDAWLLLKTDR
jgi:hypothetical protein